VSLQDPTEGAIDYVVSTSKQQGLNGRLNNFIGTPYTTGRTSSRTGRLRLEYKPLIDSLDSPKVVMISARPRCGFDADHVSDLPMQFYEAELDLFGKYMFDKRGEPGTGGPTKWRHHFEWKHVKGDL
jgi:hypothetical protein